MRTINVLSVCGSGSVTSSMIAGNVRDMLDDEGYQAQTVECNPNGVDELLANREFDIIVHTSPLKRKYDLPTINAIGLLTGTDEEGFEEELMEAVKGLKL